DVTVQYYRKRDDDLALITQVQLTGALPGLSGPEVYPYANLLAELVDALTVDVHLGERLFDYLASGLRGLVAHDDPEHVALVYAWRLLGLAGLAPTVRRCASCGALGPLVAFDAASGGLACEACAHAAAQAGVHGATYLGAAGAAELRDLVEAPMREALTRPPADRERHWRALRRHVDYHVRELNSLAARAVGYLLGGVPPAYLLARARGRDVFAVGSGSMGAMNTARNVSPALGAAVLVVDAAKGALAAYLGALLGGLGAGPGPLLGSPPASLGAATGHRFSPFVGFRAGALRARAAGGARAPGARQRRRDGGGPRRLPRRRAPRPHAARLGDGPGAARRRRGRRDVPRRARQAGGRAPPRPARRGAAG